MKNLKKIRAISIAISLTATALCFENCANSGNNSASNGGQATNTNCTPYAFQGDSITTSQGFSLWPLTTNSIEFDFAIGEWITAMNNPNFSLALDFGDGTTYNISTSTLNAQNGFVCIIHNYSSPGSYKTNICIGGEPNPKCVLLTPPFTQMPSQPTGAIGTNCSAPDFCPTLVPEN